MAEFINEAFSSENSCARFSYFELTSAVVVAIFNIVSGQPFTTAIGTPIEIPI